MNLLYFKQIKEHKKLKHIQTVKDLESAKVYVVPEALVVSEFGVREEFRSDMVKLPFERTWVEFLEPTFTAIPGFEFFWFYAIDKGNEEYFVLAADAYGAKFINLDFKQEKFIPESEGDADWTVAALTCFSCCIAAVTRKENQVGRVSGSRLIRGKVVPYQVTYVRQRNTIYNRSDKAPQEIDWQHSWNVCGHWVRIRGLGKDRSGKRIVKGMTWRVPHIKGDGSLVDKTRVLVSQKTLASQSILFGDN